MKHSVINGRNNKIYWTFLRFYAIIIDTYQKIKMNEQYSQRTVVSRFTSPLSKKRLLYFGLIAAAAIQIAGLLLFVHFLLPKKVNYNFADISTCYINPVAFPSLLKSSTNNFAVEHRGGLALANLRLLSFETCIDMQSFNGTTAHEKFSLRPFNQAFVAQSVTVTTKLPTVASAPEVRPLTSTKEAYKFILGSADATFTYQLVGNERTTPCQVSGLEITCNLDELNLAQSTEYNLKVERNFNSKRVDAIYETTIKTVEPISIIATSIEPNSIIYDNPRQINVTANKPLAKYGEVLLQHIQPDGTATGVPAEINSNENNLIITPAQALPREAKLQLTLNALSAPDGAYLDEPYTLTFTTSGGPNISNVSIATYGVDPNAQPSLIFDYDLAPSQNLSKLISIEYGGKSIDAIIKSSGRKVSLVPTTSIPRCTPVTIKVKAGVQNIYSIASSKDWSYTYRTICQETFSIGTSVQGRAITAYKFGNGPSRVIYIGATHGDEMSSKYLLDSWINELEANYPKIPASRTIIVVPLVNPDGFAAGSRTNANNVDLNRNFPTANWKKDVIMPGGNLLVNGGGGGALSEPESKALSDFILGQNPRLVLTYHSKGGMVVANEAGDSVGLASQYAVNSGYWATSESKLGTTFAYDTTGAFENWLQEKYAIPALLIELKTHTINEFTRHKSALWSTANL